MTDQLSQRVKDVLSIVIGTEEKPPVMDKPKLKKLIEEMTDVEWTQFNKVYQLLTIGKYVGTLPKEDMAEFFE